MSEFYNGSQAMPPVGPGQELATEEQPVILFYRTLLVRHWPTILASGILGLLAAFWLQRDMSRVYATEVTIRREEQPTSLVGLTPVVGNQDDAKSEIEIMRTSSLLGPVVDSMGLRLRVPEGPSLRGMIFREIRIGSDAPGGDFLLALDDGTLRLTTAEGETVATAKDGDILSGEGFFLTVDRQQLQTAGDIRFVIDARDGAIAGLASGLDVAAVEGTDLIRLSYRSDDPILAAGVPNAVAVLYQQYAAQRAKVDATRRREFIESQLVNVTDSLRRAQAQLLDFQASAQTVNPQEEGQALSQMLLTEQQKLRELVQNEGTLQNLLISLRSETRGNEGLRQMVVLSGEFFPAAQSLYGRLQELESDRSRLTSSPLIGRTANDPQVQMVDSLINVTKIEMREIAGQSLQLLRERRGVAERRVAELEEQVGAIPGRNTTFGRLEQRIAAIQRQNDVLADKFYEAQIAEAVEAGNVEIVESARVPTAPLPQNRFRNIILGLLGGLIFGVAIASLREQLDTRVKDAGVASRAAAVELIATIPVISAKTNGNARQLAVDPREVEHFRMLRTNLRFVRANRPRTIVITSPSPGDGKSVVAANLALAYATEGVRVLLVDVDLRRPVQHTIFSLPRSPGLTDLLVGQASVSAIRRVMDGRLTVLTAGSQVPNPPELLGSPAFANLLQRSMEAYEVIILDSPPVLAVTDTSVIAPAVDGVILVSRFDVTDRRALAHAANQLRRTGTSLLGLVMNGVPAGRIAGSYDYYGYQSSYDAYFKDEPTEGHTGQPRRRTKATRKA